MAPLRILKLFIKSFVNPFIDIALTFFNSSFSSFLFDVTFFSSLTKSVFFYKISYIIFNNFLLIDLLFFIIQCPLKVMCGNK